MVPNSINFTKVEFHQANEGHFYQIGSIDLSILCNMFLEEDDPIYIIPSVPTCPRLFPGAPGTVVVNDGSSCHVTSGHQSIMVHAPRLNQVYNRIRC